MISLDTCCPGASVNVGPSPGTLSRLREESWEVRGLRELWPHPPGEPEHAPWVLGGGEGQVGVGTAFLGLGSGEGQRH